MPATQAFIGVGLIISDSKGDKTKVTANSWTKQEGEKAYREYSRRPSHGGLIQR